MSMGWQIPTLTLMERMQRLLWAIGLVGSPLLLLGYFLFYPAYGEIHGVDIVRAIGDDPGATHIADVFAFAGTFLAIPATLAFMHVLRPGSPVLAAIGGGLALLGWCALVGALMIDLVAVELADHPSQFVDVYSSGFVTAVSGLATLHIVGALLLGVALWRTRLVGVPLGVAMTLAPPVHLAANLGGQLWLDALTWIITAGVGVLIARIVLGEDAAVSRSG